MGDKELINFTPITHLGVTMVGHHSNARCEVSPLPHIPLIMGRGSPKPSALCVHSTSDRVCERAKRGTSPLPTHITLVIVIYKLLPLGELQLVLHIIRHVGNKEQTINFVYLYYPPPQVL